MNTLSIINQPKHRDIFWLMIIAIIRPEFLTNLIHLLFLKLIYPSTPQMSRRCGGSRHPPLGHGRGIGVHCQSPLQQMSYFTIQQLKDSDFYFHFEKKLRMSEYVVDAVKLSFCALQGCSAIYYSAAPIVLTHLFPPPKQDIKALLLRSCARFHAEPPRHSHRSSCLHSFLPLPPFPLIPLTSPSPSSARTQAAVKRLMNG